MESKAGFFFRGTNTGDTQKLYAVFTLSHS